jgi:hypothetical protein
MTEQETIDRMVMQLLEEDCYINPEEEIEYPIPAISCGEKNTKLKMVINLIRSNRNLW